MTSHIAKIVEIVGSSEKSWQDAAQAAVTEAEEDSSWNKRIRSSGYDCKSRPYYWKYNSISSLHETSIWYRTLILNKT